MITNPYYLSGEKVNSYFIDKYGTFASSIYFLDVNVDYCWPFVEKCKEYIVYKTVSKYQNDEVLLHVFTEIFLDLKNGICVWIHSYDRKSQTYVLTIHYNISVQPELLDIYVNDIKNNCPASTNQPKINIITEKNGDLFLRNFDIKKREINIDESYNNDLKPIDKLINNSLSNTDKNGIILLHGKPGTGKTTYLRHLISQHDRDFVFIPNNIIDNFSNPKILDFFLGYKDSVFIIEDADNFLIKRNGQNNSAVSNILNSTDGLMGDVLNITIIATFNANIHNIDEALLRKGRLIAKYEFNELTADKVEKLANKLGVNISGPQILTDIYNCNEESFKQVKNKIGF